MIPFFRQIRKQLANGNKPLKYLRYAFGEIVLVVIGILIALQINNWNEKRKSILREKIYIQSIYKDLKSDIKKISSCSETLSKQYIIGIEVLKALEQKKSRPIDSSKIATYLGWNLSDLVPVDREENTWDGLKTLGKETYIINDSLTMQLNKFYSNYDGQIERFNQLPKKSRQELRELTGNCHNAQGLEIIHKHGVGFYGTSSPYTRNCILSIQNAHELVGSITMSSIVNLEIYKNLIKNAEAIMVYMEVEYQPALDLNKTP